MIKISFSNHEIMVVKEMAESVCIGGKSHIYKDNNERNKNIFENQFSGQLGELALFKYYSIDGFEQYKHCRNEKNKNKSVGDDGYDIPNIKLDIKCSNWKYNKPAEEYHLYVREREYHLDWSYILSLAKQEMETWNVYMVGWCKTKDLKMVKFEDDVRYEILGKNLKKLPERNEYKNL